MPLASHIASVSRTCCVLIAALGACSIPRPPPETTEEERLCSRAYGSLADSLTQLRAASGAPPPAFLPRGAWVARCVALGLDPDALRCLDPKLAAADDGCAAHLTPVRDRAQRLHDAILLPPNRPEPTP